MAFGTLSDAIFSSNTSARIARSAGINEIFTIFQQPLFETKTAPAGLVAEK